MNCPRCVEKERDKSGFARGKQRREFKTCQCNYTALSRNHFPTRIKRRALQV